MPSLTRAVIEEMWDYCARAATRQAEAEMGQSVAIGELSWGEVFEAQYKLG